MRIILISQTFSFDYVLTTWRFVMKEIYFRQIYIFKGKVCLSLLDYLHHVVKLIILKQYCI